MTVHTPQKPSYREALMFWLKLGFISFGGPAGQIAIMHEYLIDKKKWISEGKFLHALNYCMLLPGPEAQQLATYIGWLLHGTLGGLTAGILFVLPSMLILAGLSTVYVVYGNIPWVYALFNGLKPAIIAIVLLALVKVARRSLHSPFHYLMASAAFIGVFFLHIPFPLIVLGAILTGVLFAYFFPALLKPSTDTVKAAQQDGEMYSQYNSTTPSVGFSLRRLCKQILLSFLLWSLPLLLFYLEGQHWKFWRSMSLFFTKSAFTTFGGAYAVLPYVAQVSVEKFHWLTAPQMIDGLALGETTPGPLIMVLAFVGFMAAYHAYGGSLLMGTLGLLTTTYYTFLPSFIFIFMGGPIIEQTRENKFINGVLSFVTAAVVGVILNLTLYLAQVVICTNFSMAHIDYAAIVWVCLSFVAMYRFKVPLITWIFISAFFGLCQYFIN